MQFFITGAASFWGSLRLPVDTGRSVTLRAMAAAPKQAFDRVPRTSRGVGLGRLWSS